MENVLNKEQIKRIKESGNILKEAMVCVASSVEPGVSTLELDKIAEKEIRRRGGVPAFLNYYVRGVGSFPASLCVSINDEVVHGIPGADKILKSGDIVSLDLGVGYNSLYTDMAVTVTVGKIDNKIQKLIDITKEALALGIKETKTDNTLGDIGFVIANHAENAGFSVIRDLVGHGIGQKPHLPPQIPNYGRKGEGQVLVEGMALAIEPMFTNGNYDIMTDDDNWTIRTSDGSYSAHFEHTVVIENGKPVVVTV